MRIIDSGEKPAKYDFKGKRSNISINDDCVTKYFAKKINWLDAINWTKLSEQNKDNVVMIDSLVRDKYSCVGFTYSYEEGEPAGTLLKYSIGIEHRRYICNLLIGIYQDLLAKQTIYTNWDLDNIIIGDEIKLASPNSLRKISQKQASNYPYTNDFLLVLLSILYGFDFKNERLDIKEKAVLLVNVQNILNNASYQLPVLNHMLDLITEQNITDFKLIRTKINN